MTADRLSIAALWAEGVALARAHGAATVWIAAAFLFLPQIAVAVLGSPGPARSLGESVAGLLVGLIGAYGQLAITAILLGGPHGPRNVGEALSQALSDLPRIVLMFLIIVAFALPVGILLGAAFAAAGLSSPTPAAVSAALPRLSAVLIPLAIALIYVGGRLLIAVPTLVADGLPAWGTLRRAWGLTRGNGWRLAAFLLTVLSALMLASGVTAMVSGAVTGLLLGKAVAGKLIVAVLVGATTAVLSVINLAGGVVAYRSLANGSRVVS